MTGIIDKDLQQLVTSSNMKNGNNWGTGVICYNPVDRTILLGLRTDTKNYCTQGGKVEVGESPLQGVVRECYEESNLLLKSAYLIGYRAHTSPNGKNWVSFSFLSTDWEGEIKPQESEIVSWSWVPVDTAMNMDLFPPTRSSLEEALELGIISSEPSEVITDPINGDGNGDTVVSIRKPDFTQMPQLVDLYKNGRSDEDEISYSCTPVGIMDSTFPYPYIMD